MASLYCLKGDLLIQFACIIKYNIDIINCIHEYRDYKIKNQLIL